MGVADPPELVKNHLRVGIPGSAGFLYYIREAKTLEPVYDLIFGLFGSLHIHR